MALAKADAPKWLIISIPVETHGSINAELADWLLRVVADPQELGIDWSVRWDIVHDKPVAATRNKQAIRCLGSDSHYFLFLDSDMVPNTKAIRLLLDNIVREDVDVISGIADQQTKGGPMPVLYKFAAHYDGCRLDVELLDRDPDDGPFPMKNTGTGAACLLATRHALETIREAGRLWFNDVICDDPADERFGKRIIGQDAWFWIQCHKLGLRCWIDTNAYIGHVKPGNLAAEAYRLHHERLKNKRLQPSEVAK